MSEAVLARRASADSAFARASEHNAARAFVLTAIIRATDRLDSTERLETARLCLPVASFPDPLKISRDESHHSTC